VKFGIFEIDSNLDQIDFPREWRVPRDLVFAQCD